MNNSWLDKSFDGVSDDCLDDVIMYLDFPLEDDEGTDGGSGEGVIKDFHLPLYDVEENNGGGADSVTGVNFQNLEPPPANVLAALSSGFYGDYFSDSLTKNRTVSCDGPSQRNQQSSTTKESLSRSITLHNESADVKGSSRFQTSSPVSVLENNSSCLAANLATVNPKLSVPVKRTRSKRRRKSTFKLQFAWPFISSTSSTSRGSNSLVGSESESESHPSEKPAKKKQKKKRNLTLLSGSSEIEESPSQQPVIVRKCMHCEVTETPQWREGPRGPKTLCNACGVRFRSGRLLPEYRPAASPTFVPSLHSNSHKKVIEMRKKGKPLCCRSMLSIPPGKSPEKSYG